MGVMFEVDIFWRLIVSGRRDEVPGYVEWREQDVVVMQIRV
jgi:hypothetical protein